MGAFDEAEVLRAVDAATWRAWLERNHATTTGVWLLRPRAGVAVQLVAYDDAVRQIVGDENVITQ